MVGATIPVIGFWLLEQIFFLLENLNVVDEITVSSLARRKRTLSLLAIACNMLVVHFLKSRKFTNLTKGILVAAFIYCGFWIYYYHSALFQ